VSFDNGVRRERRERKRVVAMTTTVGSVPAVYTDSERDRAAAILLGPDGGAEVLEHIRDMALSDGSRSAMWAGLFADIVGWRGNKAQLFALIVAQLGVSMLQAQAAVRQVQQAPKDPHEIARTCREYLEWYDGPNGPGQDADAQ
jgi:hypothetical protein